MVIWKDVVNNAKREGERKTNREREREMEREMDREREGRRAFGNWILSQSVSDWASRGCCR